MISERQNELRLLFFFSPILALLFYLSPAGRVLELAILDVFTRASPLQRAVDSAVIIALDDVSFDVIAEEHDGLRWPYPRALHAEVIQRLLDAGAKAIFVDFLFDLPSGFGQEDDEKLRLVLESGRVVLAAESSSHTQSKPHPSLLAAGGALGNSVFPLDEDGKIRRVVPTFEGHEPALAELKSVLGFYNSPRSELPHAAEALLQIAYNKSYPVSPGMLLSFAGGAGSLSRISYYELLDAALFESKRSQIKDRVVFIGSTPSVSITPEQRADSFFTPLGQMPGVEIHANYYLSLQESAVRRPLLGISVPCILAAWGLFAALGLLKFPAPRSGLLFLFAAYSIWLSLSFLLFTQQIALPLLLPLVYPTIAYIGMLAIGYLRERDQRLVTRAQLFHYLPARVAEHVLKNPSGRAMAGDKKYLAILFADVAGFTSLSEKESPERVLELLQTHLKDMAEVIFAYDGTLDKYLGDGIMAFWGAPEPVEGSASKAFYAAQEMLNRVGIQNQSRVSVGLPELTLRIGLHYGEAIVGNIGSELFFDYTAIGDSVNTAARLEGANKPFGTSLMLSGELVSQLSELERESVYLIGRVGLQGRLEPIEVYTTASEFSQQSLSSLQRVIELLDKGLQKEAEVTLDTVLAENANFIPGIFHHTHIRASEPLRVSKSGKSFWALSGK